MAVGSFDQDTIDEVISAALDAGLAEAGRRTQLLSHLPPRFVAKIEEVQDAAAQLRVDVEHLNAHPRLPDHHQPPLASWLQNAYLMTTPSPQARTFRDLRGRLVGSGRQQEILRSITRIKRIASPEERSTERSRPPDPRAGTLLGGRFSLEKQLGRGAVATVWRAEDLATGTRVAVKILHRRWAEHPERRERFFAGARQMAQFAHPHIVPVVLPEGRDDGCCYCVLEYLDAGDLEAALREGRIRRNAALRALLKVAAGVAAMHAAGVMHLDLKPQNILLGTDGRVMLGDFDRVRNAATEGGSTTDTVESIFYLAPETFDESRRPGPAADVFSLGMTALFVLHGDKLPAWIVRRPSALLRRIDCPEGLRQVISRAIELEPAARQTDIESLAMAMQEALGRSPTGGLARVAPIVSAGPSPVAPPSARRAPGAGPMPRAAAPPKVGRSSGELPPVTAITGEHPSIKDSGPFRALTRSGSMPAISAAEAFDAEAASVSGSLDGSGRDLPPPSVPPPSLPPPELDPPPAGPGELLLDDSIDSALEVLDRAAAAALAEEFARVEGLGADGSEPGHDSALLPAPEKGPPIDPISDSIDLDGPGDPMHSSGHHVSIPGDENRSPWQWVERSGGFMMADDPAGSDEHSLSGSSLESMEQAPARPPWNWARESMSHLPSGSSRADAARRTDPAPPASLRDTASDPGQVQTPFTPFTPTARPPLPAARPPLPAPEPAPAPTPKPAPAPEPASEGALPLDLPPFDEPPEHGPDESDERTAEEAFLPPPPDLAGLMTRHLEDRPQRAAAETPPPAQAPEPAAPEPALEEAPTNPITPRPPEPASADEPEAEPPPAPDRRRWLAVAGLGALGAAVTWWLTRGEGDTPPMQALPEVPRPAAKAGRQPEAPDAAPPEPADAVAAQQPHAAQPDAAQPDTAVDARLSDAAVDAAQPDAARPDAAVDAAVDAVVDATPDAAKPPPPPKRRRRRRRRKPKPKPRPQKKPEPLIEIPDEIQQMLDE